MIQDYLMRRFNIPETHYLVPIRPRFVNYTNDFDRTYTFDEYNNYNKLIKRYEVMQKPYTMGKGYFVDVVEF